MKMAGSTSPSIHGRRVQAHANACRKSSQQLVRASAAKYSEFDFPTVTALRRRDTTAVLPQYRRKPFAIFFRGEFGLGGGETGEDCLDKANKDYTKADRESGSLVDQPHTTFVFVSGTQMG